MTFKECLSCHTIIFDRIFATFECPKCNSWQLYTDCDEPLDDANYDNIDCDEENEDDDDKE